MLAFDKALWEPQVDIQKAHEHRQTMRIILKYPETRAEEETENAAHSRGRNLNHQKACSNCSNEVHT